MHQHVAINTVPKFQKVLRPDNKSKGKFICFLMPVAGVESEYGLINPPYAYGARRNLRGLGD